MTIRYERETNAPVYLRANGGRVRFGQDEYEQTLDDEIEEHLVAAYDGVEYVDRPESELAADLEDLSHAQLKQLARQEGLSGDVDMRSKDILVDALSQAGVDAEAVTEPEPEAEPQGEAEAGADADADTTESAPESATAPSERAESPDAERDVQTAQETAGAQDKDPAPESATTPSERAESTRESTRASGADTNANADADPESTIESEAAAAVDAEDNAGAEAGADAEVEVEAEANPEDEEPTGTLVSTEERTGPNAGRDETE